MFGYKLIKEKQVFQVCFEVKGNNKLEIVETGYDGILFIYFNLTLILGFRVLFTFN